MTDSDSFAGTMKHLQIRAFGSLRASLAHHEITELRKAPILQALLGYLILHRGAWVSRSTLAGTLWPDVAEHYARRALNNLLWRLKQLADGRLVAALESYREALAWHLPPDSWLDLDEWEALALDQEAIADHCPTPEQLGELARQAALYRGPLLEGIPLIGCEEERQRYALQYSSTLRTLALGYAEHSQGREAIHWTGRWVAADPYDESAHIALIRLHQQAGQPLAARTAYRAYQEAWAELGLSPAPSVRQLVENAPASPDGASAEHPVVRQLAQWLPQLGHALASSTVHAASHALQHEVLTALGRWSSEIAAHHETEYQWDAARLNYEMALTVLERTTDASDAKRPRLVELRLKLDSLYDRLAHYDAQQANLDQLLRLVPSDEGALQSDLWARRCWLAQRRYRMAEAIEAASKAFTLAGENSELRAQALRLLGTSYDLSGRFAVAVQTHERALAHSVTAAGRRLCHISLANTLSAVNQPWRALAHARAAIADGVTMPPTLVDVLALGNAGMVDTALGAYEAAKQKFHQAIAHAKLLGARHLEAWLSTRQATLALWRGDARDAAFWANEAWFLSYGLSDDRTRLEAAIEWVHVTGHAGDIAAAAQWYQLAQQLAHGQNLIRYRGRLALLRAYLATQQGDIVAARDSVQHCMAEIEDGGPERLRLPALALLISLEVGDGTVLNSALQRERDAQEALIAAAPDAASGHRFVHATPYRRWLTTGATPHVALSWLW